MSFLPQSIRRRRRPESAAENVRVTVQRGGTLKLHHRPIFGHPAGGLCREFLQRVFAIEEVTHVSIDPARGEATIQHRDDASSKTPFLERMGSVLRETASQSGPPAAAHLNLQRAGGTPVHVYRHGSAVSTWKVVHGLPGRIRLAHDQLLRRPKATRYIEHELASTFGVLRSTASPRTGTVLICFNEQVVTTSQLLKILEGMLQDFENPRPGGYEHPRVGTVLAYSSVALAATAQFAAPALLPASALLLVVANVGTARTALRELRARKLGVPLLYITIVGFTLASGAFLTAALMGWFVYFWDRRSHHKFSLAQRELLAEFRRRSRIAWLCCDGAEIETEVERLDVGDLVRVRTGEMIPADGVVESGHAEVDERLLKATEGLTEKSAGDRVFANSMIFDGSMIVRVTHRSADSRAAAIVRSIEQASTPSPAQLKVRGKRFADRTVAPTLAAAGVGLAVGDLGTVLAILRPDYYSGPGMSEPLGSLHDVVACARRGIVVRNATAIDRFASSDTLLIDLQCAVKGYQDALRHAQRGALPGWTTADANRLDGHRHNGSHHNGGVPKATSQALHEMRREICRLRRDGSVRIGLVSEARTSYVASCADFLGVDFFQSELTHDDKSSVVHDHAEKGNRVAFVADCRQHAEAARLAHVSISINEIEMLDDDPADVILMNSQLPRLGEFWDLTRRQRRRRLAHQQCVIIPNLCCVAGALTLGFTGMHTLLITNLGVYTVYRSGMKWLSRLQQKENAGLTSSLNGKPLNEDCHVQQTAK